MIIDTTLIVTVVFNPVDGDFQKNNNAVGDRRKNGYVLIFSKNNNIV